jgi:small subunit ribosomal protein S3
MGQKVNPIGFRLAVNKDWRSRWFASRQEFAANLKSDYDIRAYIRKKFAFAAISKIVIERAWNSVRVTLFTARPGLVIGKRGADIDKINADIAAFCGTKQVKIDIFEVKSPELDAQLVAENIALQLERRVAFRRAMKRSVQTAMELGAEGIRVRCSGRLAGADIARTEQYREGKVPLQTLRTNIDYGFAEARTVYGIIGVKAWVTRREDDDGTAAAAASQARREARGPRRDRGDRPGGDRGGPRGGGGFRGGNRGGDRSAPPAAAPAEAPAAPAEAQA